MCNLVECSRRKLFYSESVISWLCSWSTLQFFFFYLPSLPTRPQHRIQKQTFNFLALCCTFFASFIIFLFSVFLILPLRSFPSIVPHLIPVFPNSFTFSFSFFLFNLSLKARFPYVITVLCVYLFCQFQCLNKLTDFHERYCKCYTSRGSINRVIKISYSSQCQNGRIAKL